MNWILLLLAFGLVYFFNLKAQAAKSLFIRYLLPQGVRVSAGAVSFRQPVVITNPTNTPINLYRYDVQILLEKYPVGLAFSVTPTVILPGTETTIQATVTLPIDALISAAPDVLKAGKALDFVFVGNIAADGITVPISNNISVPIPKLNL